MALTPLMKEIIWSRYILAELNVRLRVATTVFCDNQAAIALAQDPVFHKRTKSIGIMYRQIEDATEAGLLNVVYVATDDNLADINTKSSLQRDKFEYFVDSILNGVNIPTSIIKVMTKEDLGLFGF